MIEVQDLHKAFGTVKAVDGVSFRVGEGETFGLLGPNGAGKTTTLAVIIGVLAADRGTVVLDGVADSGHAAARQRLGIAPQSLALYEELSAAENLAFFARLYGLAGQRLRERVDWALEFAELSDRRRHRVRTYSGGMKRRLNLAAALVHDPQIILLDEPTVGVDPQSRNHLFERIEQLRAAGCTMIYTTHYMEEAERLCDRVAIMDHGRILDVDRVDALIDRHGGRSVIKAELVRPPEDASLLPAAALNERELRFESECPLEEIARLASAGIAFHTLEVRRPDLESVFLTLTGRSLRD